jgi:hypothetical protein
MSDNDDKRGGGFFSNPTRRVGGGSPPTVKKREAPAPAPGAVNAGGDAVEAKTRLVRPGGRSEGDQSGATRAPSAAGVVYEPEFVVGWVVVTGGPGRGASKPLGYGLNSIGRGEESQVRLDYGDEEISRSGHCQIAYDNRNRKFYVQHGGGQNLTYLGDQPVLAPSELHPEAVISLGKTTLKFVPFCGAGFEWDDTEPG